MFNADRPTAEPLAGMACYADKNISFTGACDSTAAGNLNENGYRCLCH